MRRIGLVLVGVTVTAAGAFSDEMRVTFLGTGAPRSSFERYGPSMLVEAEVFHRPILEAETFEKSKVLK